MRSWHLLLVTVGASLVLLLREMPSSAIGSPSNPPALPVARVVKGGATTRPALQQSTSAAEVMPYMPLPSRSDITVERTKIASQSRIQTNSTTLVTTAAAPSVGVGPFMALGVVSNVMWGNSFERRQLIRDTWKTYSNVGRTVHVVFVVGMLQANLAPIPPETADRIRKEQEKHGDLLILESVPERKSPCLKTMAWFRHATKTYPNAPFVAKTDDDAFVQTIKLEANVRRFVGQPHIYIGSTLWGSYIPKTFEACARRMGPMMAVGGMREEKCQERGAIGPYPYAVGMLQVLSHDTASWMVSQPNYDEFERRATAATGTDKRPDGSPMIMDHGEDMVIGMFLYLSPFPLMPLHWGWDKLHDLCFKCERKDQIWRPITVQTVVAHHTANEEIMQNVFHNITHGSHFDPRPCDDKCQRQTLPFEVTSLKDLCSRGSIKSVYSKCKML